MTTYNATEARAKLYYLIAQAGSDRKPVTITSRHGNVVLVSEDDWDSIQETLYLLSVPGMRESIREGMETPVEDCSEDPGW